jgi:RNA polymerase sigma-70 factor (ECF subfamily)
MSAETLEGKIDAELVLRARQGSEAAFTELIRRHKEKAVQLAYAAVGNYEDAKDISQEAFVKAYRALKDFHGEAQFSTWFYRILMNAAKDFHRRKRWTNFLAWKAAEDMDRFFEQVPGRGAAPGQGALDEELGARMAKAIEKLPAQQRWIFTLRFVEGLSLREIGEVTQLAEGTIKAALHFAVQKFKKEMTHYVGKTG